MKKNLLFIKLVITILLINIITIDIHASNNLTNSDTYWPESPNIFAESAILMEASTGLILYEKNMHQVNYPASITKIMTALIALENSSLNDNITFSNSAVFDVDLNSSRIGMDVGEVITMRQALYGMMLESANEVSHAIAEQVAGNVDDFSKLMNEKAKDIGCLNTNFVNPHGLPDNEHVTTAYDMALITREAMKNPIYRKITSTRTYQIPPTNKQSEIRYLRNHHKFILKEKFFYDDCIGGKTGYTSKSKYTLVTTVKRNNLELIVVVMKDDTIAHQYEDTIKLLDYGYNNFSVYSISDIDNTNYIDESPLFTRFSPLLNNSNSSLYIDPKGSLILPNSVPYEEANKDINFITNTDSNIIGEISYKYNEKIVGNANIYLSNNDGIILSNEYLNSHPQVQDDFMDSSTKSKFSMKTVYISLAFILFVIAILLYYIIVELPRLKRRKSFYKRRAKRKNDFDLKF